MKIYRITSYFNALLNLIMVLLKAYGIDPKLLIRGVIETPKYLVNLWTFLSMTRRLEVKSPNVKFADLRPTFGDRAANAGNLGAYFYQDLWAAKKIFSAMPLRHVDIGSRIDGFIGHLLVFRNVEVIDLRPVRSEIPGLNFVQSDATNLDGIDSDSLESISCLHAAEHFGLGRYGDQVDPLAPKKFFKSLIRVLRLGGSLYLSLPIGVERVSFDAHRVFSVSTILEEFTDLELVEFSAFSKKYGFVENADNKRTVKDRLQVGLFHFIKRVDP